LILFLAVKIGDDLGVKLKDGEKRGFLRTDLERDDSPQPVTNRIDSVAPDERFAQALLLASSYFVHEKISDGHGFQITGVFEMIATSSFSAELE
jgi:hypothetical protein